MALLKMIQTTKSGHTKTWKLDSKKTLYTFGVSRKSDIVSIDKSFAHFEGTFEYRADGWHFITFDIQSPDSDLAISNNVEFKIKDSRLQLNLIQKEENQKK